MSKKYIIKKGDTLTKISQRFYGTPQKYMDIFNASNFKSGNPNIIQIGEIAFLPEIVDDKIVKINTVNNNEVVIKIEDRIFIGWQADIISLSMLEFADTFSFSFPFDGVVEEFLTPYIYPKIQIYIGEDLILTGQIEYIGISTSSNEVLINIQGSSKAGLSLNSQLDIVKEYNNQALSKIAQEVFVRYGIQIIAEEDVIIQKANFKQNDTLHSFLTNYVVENALLLYSLPTGEVILTKVNLDKQALQTLKLGDGQVQKITTSFDGREMFSSFKILSQSLLGDSKKSVIKNSFIDIYKPSVKMRDYVVNIELTNKSEYLSSFAKANKIQVTLIGWRKKDGSLWKKNENVIIDSPMNNIIRPTKFLIVHVKFIINSNKQFTVIDCVMPEAYSQEDIKEVFWK